MNASSRQLLPLALLALSSLASAQTCPLTSFGPPGSLAVTGAVSRFLTVDVSGDGLPDLVAFGDGKVTVLLARPEGGLGDPRVSTLPAPLLSPTLRDVDGDGRPDLVGIVGVAAGRLALFRGDGAGRFAAMSAPTVDVPLLSVAAGDFDGDGRVDLFAIPGGQTLPTFQALLFTGGPGGTFGEPRSLTMPGGFLELSIGPLVAGDLDRDGVDDVLVFRFRGDVRVFFGGRDGFRLGGDLFIGYYPLQVELVDLDGDGDLDVVGSGTPRVGSATLATYRNDGHGTFTEISRLDLAPGVTGPTVADFDGDGRLDVAIVVGTYGGSVRGPRLLAGSGDGALGTPAQVSGEDFAVLGALDADRDGRADLVAYTPTGGVVLLRKTCSAGSESATLVIPVIVSLVGSPGTFFESDLTWVDTGSSPCNVEMEYVASLGSGSGRVTVPLGAGEQRYEPKAISLLARSGLNVSAGEAAGTLRLRFDGLASARDAAALVRTTTGGAGVAYPAVRLADALRGTSLVGWLREDARDRTNLALVNAGAVEDGDVTLRVTLVSTDPATRGRTAVLPDVVLHAGGFTQVNRVLSTSTLAASSAFARIERVAGTAPYLAYAVVNDETTSDGSIVFARPVDSVTAAGGLVVPAVVEAGTFETEVLLTNAASAPRRLTLEYVAEAIGVPSRVATLEVELDAGEQRAIPSFVDALRAAGTPGIGPRGPAFAGALFVTAIGPADGVFAGARVVSTTPTGRYGVFVPSTPIAGGAASAALLPGLRQDGSVRSNLALVSLGDGVGADDVFEIDLYDGASRNRVATLSDVRVPPRGWLQLGSILATYAPGTAQGYARIRRVAGDHGFLAYAVINDGEGPGQGTGDGSYVPMSLP